MKEKKHKFFDRSDLSLSEVVAASVTFGLPVASLVKEAIGTDKLEHLDMMKEFDLSGEKLVAGDMSYLEKALLRQFVALDTLFAELGFRGMRGKDMSSRESYLKLALRAQSQARTAAETLSSLKNPSVVFAHQANVAAGPQQINNIVSTQRVERKETAPNELFTGDFYGGTMDRRTPGETSLGHPTMEAMGGQHRAEDGRREGSRQKK